MAGVSAVLVLLASASVGFAWDPYTELPRELVGYDSRKEIHIHSAAEADKLRRSVIDYLWGGAGLPAGKLPTVTAVYSGSGALPADLAGLRAANIARAERLQANMDFRYSTGMYLLAPGQHRQRPASGHRVARPFADYNADSMRESAL